MLSSTPRLVRSCCYCVCCSRNKAPSRRTNFPSPLLGLMHINSSEKRLTMVALIVRMKAMVVALRTYLSVACIPWSLVPRCDSPVRTFKPCHILLLLTLHLPPLPKQFIPLVSLHQQNATTLCPYIQKDGNCDDVRDYVEFYYCGKSAQLKPLSWIAFVRLLRSLSSHCLFPSSF